MIEKKRVEGITIQGMGRGRRERANAAANGQMATQSVAIIGAIYNIAMSVRDLIIVGAGPSGLSAAIAAKQRDLDYQVLEQGVLVNSIYRFPPQMVFFTTPELLEIGGLPFVSPFDKPTRAEALKYYRKVVDVHDLRIAYQEKVVSVRRERDEEAGGARPAPQERE